MRSVGYAVDPTAHELDRVVRSKIPVPGTALLSHGSRMDVPLTTAQRPGVITDPFFNITASQNKAWFSL